MLQKSHNLHPKVSFMNAFCNGDRKMNQTCHVSAYRSAMNAAMDKLGLLHEEAIRVSNRMDQLDSILEALKPFLTDAKVSSPVYKPAESVAKPVPGNGRTPPMVGIAVSDVGSQKMIESTDPIQRRINSALGLAVA
jgi:hypothetical protein